MVTTKSSFLSRNVTTNSKPNNRSRLETNILRLLSRCEKMTIDSDSIPQNWRLDKYAAALDVMLSDLKSGPNQPDKDTLLEYGRKIEFIKGILHTAKLTTASEKVVASQLIKPGSLVMGSNSHQSMEIKQRHANKYTEDLRKELLGDTSGSSGSLKEKDPEDLDELLKYHHSMQEKIADHMLDLTRSLKDQIILAGDIVKKDTEVLDKSGKTMDTNQLSLQSESEKLEKYNKGACKCWVWFVIVLVSAMFIGMVLFMKLFRKRLVVVDAGENSHTV